MTVGGNGTAISGSRFPKAWTIVGMRQQARRLGMDAWRFDLCLLDEVALERAIRRELTG